MRFPRDDDEAVALIRHAIDAGMTYIDTCRGYGDSERKLGKALKDGYREKVILSTKWSPWVKKIEDDDDTSADRVLRRIEESMKRLDVDYLDFYQVWNINTRERYELAVRPGGFIEGVMKAKERGLVGHTGFTTHDSVENLLVYLDEVDWCEVLLVTYNMLNRTYEPVLARAREKGVGTIVMNPVGGGKLASAGSAYEKVVAAMGCASLAELAVRWVLSNPHVDTIISGIAKHSDVDETLAAARRPRFTAEQMATINGMVESMSPARLGFCTHCEYCMPCPHDVNIPRVMDAIYLHRYQRFVDEGRTVYHSIGDQWTKGKNAEACTACGECVPKCTLQLAIPDEMAWARATWPNPPDHGRP
jgi:hypothetical protein